MAFRVLEARSPNFDPAARHERAGVLFHHSELGFAETVAHMQEPSTQVSYHCLIGADGTRCTLVPDEGVAWHAGASEFLGRTRCNDFLLGVAFPGSTYAAPLTRAQLDSTLEWLQARWVRYHWSIERMTDHRQVSPGRKQDLNPLEWERLRAAIAHHFPPDSFPR